MRSAKTLAICATFLGAAVLFSSSANAKVRFTFDYSQNAPGVGFLDPAKGAMRQQALATAANKFGDLFNRYFSNVATVTIRAKGIDDSADSLLAGAGSFIVGNSGFGNGDAVRNMVINHVSLTGSSPQGFVDINFATPFQLDPNVRVAPGQVDFFSVLDHEFTHALGFQSIFSITDT